MNCIHLAQDKDSCEQSNEPSGSIELLGISWVAEQLAASQAGLSSMESVSYSKEQASAH
jgi:hypothetical protein